jgi:hypothetical protein
MNRRDALKTFAAVAAGGSLPSAGAVVNAPAATKPLTGLWTHWSETQSFGFFRNGEYEVLKWVTPPWQRLYWTPEFAEQVRIEKEEVARKNIECPPTFRFVA